MPRRKPRETGEASRCVPGYCAFNVSDHTCAGVQNVKRAQSNFIPAHGCGQTGCSLMLVRYGIGLIQGTEMACTVTSSLKNGYKRKCHKCGGWFTMFVMGRNGRWVSHICKDCYRKTGG